MLEISINKSYRLRLQCISAVENLSKFVNKNLFHESFFFISLNLLTDSVFLVRESACNSIKNLLMFFDYSEEFAKKLNEKLNEMKISQNYLIRITLLTFIQLLLMDDNGVIFVETYLELLLKMSKDKMSNVRLNCAIIFNIIQIKTKSQECLSIIKNAIEYLKNDSDVDVINLLNTI